MKLHAARVAMLLVLALTACHDKNQVQNQPPLAPPIEDTPPPPPSNAPANLPPPVITVPQPQPQPSTQAQETPPPPPPKPKHHKKPAETTDQQNAQVAQNNGAPQVSAEGNFTPVEPADLRKQTSDSIAETEKGLGAITRKLSDQEQKTKDQILEFLKQAKSALGTGDVDGAHNLALKAKVLLGELNQ
jgi:outer membrane biosynthesis protein TonB